MEKKIYISLCHLLEKSFVEGKFVMGTTLKQTKRQGPVLSIKTDKGDLSCRIVSSSELKSTRIGYRDYLLTKGV